jgi:hypothetical protein
MNRVANSRRVWLWLVLAAVLVAAVGCETFMPHTPYPPPAPAPPPVVAPPPSRPPFYVAASRLNLRACAGMDCPRIATLQRNEEVEILAEAEDWAQIKVKRDGSIGWVAMQYLSDRPVPVEMAPAAPAPSVGEPPAPDVARPEPPPAEPAAPLRPPETVLPGPPRPAEAAPPAAAPVAPGEPGPPRARPEPAAPEPEEPPVPPTPGTEPPKRIRIM